MSSIVLFHIFTGTIAVLSGTVAMAAKKGHNWHRKSGKIFFSSMIFMTMTGTIMGFLIKEMIMVVAGSFTCYLVVTSWAAVNRKKSKRLILGGFITAFIISLGAMIFGIEALNSASGLKDGYPAFDYFFFSGLALLSVALDANLYFRDAIAVKHWVARHLWRMCFAYFIAAGSLFTGPGAKVFGESVNQSGVLSIPEPLILLLMLFWLSRTLRGNTLNKSNLV